MIDPKYSSSTAIPGRGGRFGVAASIRFVSPVPEMAVRWHVAGPRGGKVRGRFDPNPSPIVNGTATSEFTTNHIGGYRIWMTLEEAGV